MGGEAKGKVDRNMIDPKTNESIRVVCDVRQLFLFLLCVCVCVCVCCDVYGLDKKLKATLCKRSWVALKVDPVVCQCCWPLLVLGGCLVVHDTHCNILSIWNGP